MQSIFDKAAERDIRCGAPPATAPLRCQSSLSSQGSLACFNVFPSKEVIPVKTVQQKDVLHTLTHTHTQARGLLRQTWTLGVSFLTRSLV